MTRPVNLRDWIRARTANDGVTRIVFPAPCKPVNLNDRGHWAERMRATRAWRNAADLASRGVPPQPSPSNVRLVIGVPDPGRRRDPSNWMPTVKACVDGITGNGVFPDDDSTHVTIIEPAFRKGADCIIEIWPRETA